MGKKKTGVEEKNKTTPKFSKILKKCNRTNKYKLSIHKTNGYWYASTQSSYKIDPKTGKKKYTHIHWGTLTHDLKFFPNETFFFAEQSVRDKLIYPADWDLSPMYDLLKSFKLFTTCKIAKSGKNVKNKKVNVEVKKVKEFSL